MDTDSLVLARIQILESTVNVILQRLKGGVGVEAFNRLNVVRQQEMTRLLSRLGTAEEGLRLLEERVRGLT